MTTTNASPPSHKPSENLALMYATVTVLCWSTVSSAFKLSLQNTTPLELLWVASLSSAALLTLLGYCHPRWHIRTLWQNSEHTTRLWQRVGLLACLNPVSYYLLLFAAYDRLPGQLAQPLNFTWPLVLLLLQSLLRRQWLTTRQWIALLLSFFGVLWIATGGQPLQWPDHVSGLGVGLALISTLFWAIYWLLNSHIIEQYRYNAIPLLAMVSWVGSIILTLIVMAMMAAGHPTSLNTSTWIGGFYVGCFEMGIAFVCWQLALSHTQNPQLLGNIIYLTPFGSLLVLSIFVETIQPSSWVGLVFIIVGIILQSLDRSRNSR